MTCAGILSSTQPYNRICDPHRPISPSGAWKLLATKLRALYQRRKGRDLFDLWIALDGGEVDDQVVVDGLRHYMRGATFSYRQLDLNLQGKIADRIFLEDLTQLVAEVPVGYDPRAAAALVLTRLGVRLRNAPGPR